MNRIKQWMYYFIIGITSLIALLFLPMIGSNIGLAWNTPNTLVGWIVWIAVKTMVAVLNVIIFHSFMQQAKLNVKDNPKYVEAREILMQVSDKKILPRSPAQWNRRQYGTKGVSIFISTALATIALTQAILKFDWVSMLTYLFVIILGIVFGILQMKSAEEYWTDEFYRYAIMIRDERLKQASIEHSEITRQAQASVAVATQECIEQRNANMGANCGTDILVSCDSNNPSSSTNQSVVLDCGVSNNPVLGGTVYASSTSTDRVSTITKKTIL